MRYKDLIEPGNEKDLKELYHNYFKILNEWGQKGMEPPLKETAAKLGLHIDEYQEFLIDVSNDGYKMLIDDEIANDFNRGAEPVNDLWNNTLNGKR